MDSRSKSLPPILPSYAPGRPSDLVPDSSLRGVKRKRSFPSESDPEEPEVVRPSKQLKSPGSGALSDDYTTLSEANLREHDAQTMSSVPSLKRSSSRRAITAKSDITSDSYQAPRSTISSSSYRFQHLAAARVRLNTEPPHHIKTTIDAIIGREHTQERLDKLNLVAKDLHKESKKRVSASDGEDDFVHIFLQALRGIKSDALCYHQKADWREELKPLPAQPSFNLDALADSPVANTTSALCPAPPRKRQQRSSDKPQPSTANALDVSQHEPPPVSAMLPPSAGTVIMERDGDRSLIKTPRPDISIGIDKTGLISRLVSPLISNSCAQQLFPWLQDKVKRSFPDRPSEPLLISVPASRASDLTFPFAAVEGKAYSTGKPIFEAQNQAAVAGACALKIQLDLEDITRRAVRRSNQPPTFSNPPPLLFFSVCTEGPIHELWAHYILDEDGSSTFASTILKICNTGLLDTVETFLVAFDNICHWGTGEFLDYVVERLQTIASLVGME
jgi:hypothetical protein